MGRFRQGVRRLLQRLSGWEIARVGHSSFALIHPASRSDAWFAQPARLRDVLESLKVDLVVDAGANEGQFVQEIREWYRGEIHSFEPVAATFQKLAAAAAGDPFWHVHQMALGSATATLPMHVAPSTVFSSLLKANDYAAGQFGERALGTEQEMVPVRRLDEQLPLLVPTITSRRVFLKLDTQGYDLEVFRGLGNLLGRVMALQSEVSMIALYEGMPDWKECLSAYEQAGFGVAGFFPVSWDLYRVIEYDCLMVRRGGPGTDP